MAQQCGKGVTGRIKLIWIHLENHEVHGFRVLSMKNLEHLSSGLVLPKSLPEHTIWLTFQVCMSLKEKIVNRPNEGGLSRKWYFYQKQPWKHPTVLDRLGMCMMVKSHHIKMLLTIIILERGFPAICLNSAFIRFKSTSLRETITLVRVPSLVPAPWNNRYISLWCQWMFKG